MLTPTRVIVFLGFVIDSRSMKVSVGEAKCTRDKNRINNFHTQTKISIRDVAKLLGVLQSLGPGVRLCLDLH